MYRLSALDREQRFREIYDKEMNDSTENNCSVVIRYWNSITLKSNIEAYIKYEHLNSINLKLDYFEDQLLNEVNGCLKTWYKILQLKKFLEKIEEFIVKMN